MALSGEEIDRAQWLKDNPWAVKAIERLVKVKIVFEGDQPKNEGSGDNGSIR